MLIYTLCMVMIFNNVLAQSYEDRRCRCVCPSVSAVFNKTTSIDRQLFIANVPPSQCHCDAVILPHIGSEVVGHERDFCSRCDCKYESRNTTVIKVVVIMLVCGTSLLLTYMVFLLSLNPFVVRKKSNFYKNISIEETHTLLGLNNDE